MALDPAVRTLIATFRRSPNWDDALELQLLQQLWPSLVGDNLAAAIKITAIHGATAVLDVPDLVWRKEMTRIKWQLLKRINESWGTKRITEIAFTYENK